MCLDKFYNSVPKGKEGEVKEKITALVKELEENDFNFKALPNGLKFKQIQSIDQTIYKIKVGKSDRMLFTFGGKFYSSIRNEHKHSLVLLEYCAHDTQIRAAKERDFAKQTIQPYWPEESVIITSETEGDMMVDFSLEKSTPIVIDSKRLDQLFGDESQFYYLNDEQYNLVRLKEKGEFVFGSAGSGKTTIGVYKLIHYLQAVQGADVKICYFTFSKILRDKTQQLFEKIAVELFDLPFASFKNKVEFYTVEEYVERVAGENKKIITYEKCKRWYRDQQFAHSLDPAALWKERRGILHGMIGANWQYDIRLPAAHFDEQLIRHLSGRQLIRLDEQTNDFCFQSEMEAVCEEIEHVFSNGAAFRTKVIAAFNEQIAGKKTLTEQEYAQLNSSYSSFSKQEQEKAVKFFNKYDEYVTRLHKDGFAEEGELVRSALRISKPLYDYMIIDEVQDLTELQVYYLAQLLKEKNDVFICGDFHQTINPTFFNVGRIESIFRFLGGIGNFTKGTLMQNYRSSQNIVNFANEIAELRRHSISGRLDFEYAEMPKRGKTRNPYLFSGNQKLLWAYIKDKSYVSIVVASDQAKRDFLFQYPDLEPRVMTIAEIKGIEKKYIITFNIISDFKKQWSEVFDRQKLHAELYRYYFNMLYVAATRARDVLGMVEEDLPVKAENWLLNRVDMITHFDVEELDLQEHSTHDDLLEEARQLETNLYLDQALAAYKRLSGKGSSALEKAIKAGISRCEIKKDYELTKDHNQCGEKLLELQEYDEALEYVRKGDNAKALFTALLFAPSARRLNLNKELEKLQANPLELLLELNDPLMTNRYIETVITPFTHQQRELVRKSALIKERIK